MEHNEKCHLCLDSISLNFTETLSNENRYLINNKILDYLSINIQCENNIIPVICEDCYNNLYQFHKFAQKVYQAQMTFQNDFKLYKYETQIIEDNLPLTSQTKNDTEISSKTKELHEKYANNTEINIQSIETDLGDTKCNTQTENSTKTIDTVLVSNDEDITDLEAKKKTFPKDLIKDCRLTISGKELDKLLATFFNLNCNICTKTTNFMTIHDLTSHYEKVHNTKGYVLCCGQKISKQKSMAMHMASHIQPEAFTCSICSKILSCPKILENHKQNHLPESQRPLCCPEPSCPRRFSYYSALITHQASHLSEEEKLIHICEECGKIFGTSSALSSHINKTHKIRNEIDKYKYVCHICAHRFSNSGNLEYHLTTHEHKMCNQIQCTKCGKWSKNKQCLAKHMVQHTESPFSCEFCPYKSKSKQALRLHIQTHHVKGKHHSCTVCGKTFKMKCTLNAHIAQHTGEKKYKCNFCDRSFVNSGNFYAHRKRMHPVKLKEYYAERTRLENEERMKILLSQQ